MKGGSAVSKPYDIYLSTERNNPVSTNIRLCQGDNDITFRMYISDFDLTGRSVSIVFKKSNGLSIEGNTVISDDKSYCSYNLVGSELESPGKVVVDLKFFGANQKRISTASFIFDVDPDYLTDETIPPTGYSARLEQAIQEANKAVNVTQVSSLPQASVNTLGKIYFDGTYSYVTLSYTVGDVTTYKWARHLSDADIVDNLAGNIKGKVLDSTQGAALKTQVDTLNESLKYGSVSLALTTPNVTATIHVNFDKAFVKQPSVTVTPVTSAPNICFAAVTNVTTTGFDIRLNRNDLLSTWIYWIAIGI